MFLLFSSVFLVIRIEILGVGLHAHLSKCQKGYMARESLGTPVLNLSQGNSDRLNKSVCCFDWFLAWFTDLHGNKGNGI